MERSRNHLVIFLNGQKQLISEKDCFMMAADFLRYQKNLSGTKIVCAEGDCGACTILIFRPGIDSQLVPINACIVPMMQLDGAFIITIEALKENKKLSLVQEAILEKHGSQCGYCTPGFVMAMSACFEEQKACSAQKIKNCLTGNLCRCTGYQPFLDAAAELSAKNIPSLTARFVKEEQCEELKNARCIPISMKGEGYHFEAPRTLQDADKLLAEENFRLFSGATDVGVHINKDKLQLQKILSLQLIAELYEIKEEEGRIMVGARLNLESLRKFVKTRIPSLARFINIFASPQIKNMATLAGNIANASPIADMIPFMMIADGKVHARSLRGTREIAMSDFFIAYKKLDLAVDEYISHLSFLPPKKSELLALNKVSQRRDLDIATVNSAFLMQLESGKIIESKIAFGGIGPTVKRLLGVENFLRGKELNSEHINEARQLVQQEISPQSDLRGSATYRRMLADNLFMRFCSEYV